MADCRDTVIFFSVPLVGIFLLYHDENFNLGPKVEIGISDLVRFSKVTSFREIFVQLTARIFVRWVTNLVRRMRTLNSNFLDVRRRRVIFAARRSHRTGGPQSDRHIYRMTSEKFASATKLDHSNRIYASYHDRRTTAETKQISASVRSFSSPDRVSCFTN